MLCLSPMRKIVLSASGLVLGLMLNGPAVACMCVGDSPPELFNRAKVIFIGQMLGGTEEFSVPGKDRQARSVEAGSVRFAIEETFKGDLAKEVTVEVHSDRDNSCGPYGLQRGERYLVYAHASEREPNLLHVGSCNKTKLVDSATEDLEFLRNLPPPGTGGTLRGLILKNLHWRRVSGFADFTVHVRGPDRRLMTAVTDQTGNFEIKGLKPGKYRVEPQFPPNYAGKRGFNEVQIDDRGMARVQFEAVIDGRVQGRLVDRQGRAYDFARLYLQDQGQDERDRLHGHSTGRGGNFEFTGVPPGTYLLHLELRHAEDSRNQKFYYPGTFERAQAAVIQIGLAETARGLEFRLPDGFEVRIVEGQVTRQDGKPAADATVSLNCTRSASPDGFFLEAFHTSTRTDAAGRFELEAFTGEIYWLEAHVVIDEDRLDGILRSPRIRIAPAENALRHALVLSQPGFGHGCGH